VNAISQSDSSKTNSTRGRERRRVAWGMLWVTIALTVLHLPLLPGYYDWRITVQGVAFPSGLFLLVDVVDMLYTLGMAALGALVISSQPGNRIGWLIALIGLGSAVLRLTGHYAVYAYIIDTGGNLDAVRFPAAQFAAWLQHWLWVSVIALESIAIALLFPNGRLPSRWWWIFAIAAAAWIAFGSFVIAFHPFIPIENYFVGSGFQLGNPYASQAVADLVAPVFFTLAPHFLNVIYALIVIANLSLVVRYVRANGQQRQQIKWFAYALVITGILFVVRNQFSAVNASEGFPLLLEVIYLLAISTLPVVLGIAIFQYRLWDIDTLINRTLVYATLTVVLVGVYLVVVVAVGSTIQTGADLSLSILATMIVAASFQGLRNGCSAVLIA
jgi:hypothetical protein